MPPLVPHAGARLMASWREFTRQAATGRFSLEDESAPLPLAAAAGDPLEFLRGFPMLAPLVGSTALADAYLEAAGALESGCVDALLGAGV